MTGTLLHVGIEDGSARVRDCPPGDVDVARKFARNLRDGAVRISETWAVVPVALPPGGAVFDLSHGKGVVVSRSWLCFSPEAGRALWARIFEDMARGDVRGDCPVAERWLATGLRAAGLSLVMADDRLRAEADLIVLRTAWALLLEPHHNQQTVFPRRKPAAAPVV